MGVRREACGQARRLLQFSRPEGLYLYLVTPLPCFENLKRALDTPLKKAWTNTRTLACRNCM